MKRARILSFLLWALLGGAGLPGWSQAQPATLTYAVKGADTLWMHHYAPQGAANGMTVVFVHGGAFTGGDPVNQKPFAEGMTQRGYRVFVLKYRLYLKGKSFGCETATPEKLTAIKTAIEDVDDAGAYLVQHARTLGVDTSRMFLAGSSAGAEAVLNAVFNSYRPKGAAPQRRYRGVLAFAGAVLDINALTKEAWVPLLLMHGTRDQLVPYGTAAHRFCRAGDAGWLMMFGSHTILLEARRKGWPAVLYAYEGGGHEVSNYMFRRFHEMDNFMQAVVAQKPPAPALITCK
ncbi:MAG TPA: alpha/beta hydrolase fold domain-containing protein [Chitinophagaceae bacterium]